MGSLASCISDRCNTGNIARVVQDSSFVDNVGGSAGAWNVSTQGWNDMGVLNMTWTNVNCSGNVGDTGGCLFFSTPAMLSTHFSITNSAIDGNTAVFGGALASSSRCALRVRSESVGKHPDHVQATSRSKVYVFAILQVRLTASAGDHKQQHQQQSRSRW